MAQRPKETKMAAVVRYRNLYETAITWKRKEKYSDVPAYP